MERNQIIKRSLSFLLVIIMCFTTLVVPLFPDSQATAHEAAVILPYLDSVNGGYSVSVELEDSGPFAGGHLENDTINFSNMANKDITEQMITGDSDWTAMSKITDINDSAVSLTGAYGKNIGNTEVFLGWPASGKDATSTDMNRATEVATTLTRTLNTMIRYATGGTLYEDSANGRKQNIDLTMSAVYNLDPKIKGSTITIGKYTFTYGTTPGEPIKINDVKVNSSDKDGNLLVYVTTEGQKFETDTEKERFKSSGMIWAMPKGYNEIKLSDTTTISPIITDASNNKDVNYVSMFMIAQYANNLYRNNGTYLGNSGKTESANWLMKFIYNIFNGILSGLKSLLGLYDMDELIFNEGSRGSIGFEDGLMHSTWWKIVIKYFTIFQLIAWMFIAVAIAKTLIQVNLGTITSNSQQRAQLMDSIVKLFTVGLLLTLCIPIVRLLVQVNNAVVNVFAAGYSGNMAKIPESSNLFVGVIMMFFYFGMTFYTNFIYIMRSITLAVLVAMGPFFIVTMAFSKRNLFESWLKEVVANIYLQAFHAFAFSFLFEAIVAGGGVIERIAVVFAIFPLTEFFRSLVFGQAGGFAVSTGKALGNMAKNMTTSAIGAVGGVAVGGALNKVAKHNSISLGANKASGKFGGAAGSGGESDLGAKSETVQQGLRDQAAVMKEKGGDMDLKGAAQSSRMAGAISAVGGLASYAGNVAGGIDKMMDGMAMGDGHAMREGSKQLGATAGDVARVGSDAVGGIARADASRVTGQPIKKGESFGPSSNPVTEHRRAAGEELHKGGAVDVGGRIILDSSTQAIQKDDEHVQLQFQDGRKETVHGTLGTGSSGLREVKAPPPKSSIDVVSKDADISKEVGRTKRGTN